MLWSHGTAVTYNYNLVVLKNRHFAKRQWIAVEESATGSLSLYSDKHHSELKKTEQLFENVNSV